MGIYILKFIGVMVAMIMVDFCWAKYFIYVAKHKPFLSALWGSVIILFGAFTTINYVEDRTLLIAAFLGGFIGTYTAVLIEKKKKDKENGNV